MRQFEITMTVEMGDFFITLQPSTHALFLRVLANSEEEAENLATDFLSENPFQCERVIEITEGNFLEDK